MNYLTIGYDCSPAVALRNMNLRKFALPFDWVQSNIHAIERCFQDNFAKYHTGLYFNERKTRMIDAYGFQFPHDYPLLNIDELLGPAAVELTPESVIPGEGAYEEKQIVENWQDYYDIVKEKYNRRIERFLDILHNPAPILVLCRYPKEYVFCLKKLFSKYYKKENIYFINSSHEAFENGFMVNIHTEKNGEWNETGIWQNAVNKLINQYS